MLIMLYTIAIGVTTSVFYFSYGCNGSGIANLLVYGPPTVAGVIAQSFWRKDSLLNFR
jgi:hypothetical protein